MTTPLRNGCRNHGVVQQPSFPLQTFFQLLHIMDLQTVDPVLKDTPDVVVHWIQISGDDLWCFSQQQGDSVTCTM